MLFQSICHKERLNFLVEKYSEIINSEISADFALVLVLNPYQKSLFLNEIKKRNPGIEISKLKVYTLYGLCYNSFSDNIEYIKKLLNYNEQDTVNLCGLEVSQYIFKQCIKEADFSDYISKVNLLHQLFRRYSLIVQNCLAPQEVKERSEILNETFYKEAQQAIENYKKKTIEYKSFDYLRQLAILPLIYKDTNYFEDIKYLFINDADEYPYALWEFINKISKQTLKSYITYDKCGSTRCGYLCAYKNGINDYKNLYNIEEINGTAVKKFRNEAQKLYENIKNGTKTELKNIKFQNAIRRLDMLNSVLKEVETLIKKGAKPQEISIVTPIIDNVLTGAFEQNNSGLKFQFLSGGEKLSEVKTTSLILSILKFVNDINISSNEIRNILINLLKIPYKECFPVIKEYKNNKNIMEFLPANDFYADKFKKFKAVISSLKAGKNSLPEQIKIIFENIIKNELEGYDKQKYEFLLKEAQGFESAFMNSIENIAKEFVIQTENSIISENPSNSFELKANSIIVSSPQKIIDYSLESKYMLWLDFSSNEWQKQDTGTLYNALVFNRDWDKKEYSFDDNIIHTRDKTARMIRKLCLLANKEIHVFSSLYDNTMCENFGGLNDYIDTDCKEKPEFNITPRSDQKKVLEYKSGKMGIMAVPGAGKTTILLLLIIKLMSEGVKPENIFVLTYMESAAKNFKEKIQNAMPDNSTIPNISTIHGLALRIIKENGSHNRIGLDENFEICDDTTKDKIIRELFFKLKINEENLDTYTKCISAVKLTMKKIHDISKFEDIKKFFLFFNEYNIALKSRNLLDYDDMLCFAVKILEENPDILKYYRNICHYVIEDEAQDSTLIQQKLIELLTGKYQNYVRCGDINQAITSTFTNSSIESFKKFIKENTKTEMHSSQRCSKPVYSLANSLVKNYNDTNAFYPIEITGTKDNPQTDDIPVYKLFENEKEEKNYIINQIKNIKKQDKNASIAILLRLNYQVNEYSAFLESNSVKTEVQSDCLSQKNIYKIIYAVLKTVINPQSNTNILNLAKCYELMKIKQFSKEDYKLLSPDAKPFYNLKFDDIESESLEQLYLDIDYWLNNIQNDISSLALEIGLYYAKTVSDKSNVYIISTFIKRMEQNTGTQEELINQIDYFANKTTNALKFFEDEFQANETGVKIMTMHKSKGDEFDYVFIPEFNEENYAVEIENVKLKSGGHFLRTIKNLAGNSGIKPMENVKTEQINETLRLIYVGITRAKKSLCFSNAKNYIRRKNTKNSKIFV